MYNNETDDANPLIILWLAIHAVSFIFFLMKLFGLLQDLSWIVVLLPLAIDILVILGVACAVMVLAALSHRYKR